MSDLKLHRVSRDGRVRCGRQPEPRLRRGWARLTIEINMRVLLAVLAVLNVATIGAVGWMVASR